MINTACGEEAAAETVLCAAGLRTAPPAGAGA